MNQTIRLDMARKANRVWWEWCRRSSQCVWCGEKVELRTKCVRSVLWSERSQRRWMFTWHPSCYMADRMAYLDEHPYVPLPRGRKKGLELGPEARVVRRRLLQLGSYYKRRLLRAIEQGHEEAGLRKRLQELAQGLKQCGGLPTSWRGYE